MTNDKLKMTNYGINYLNNPPKADIHLTLVIGHLTLIFLLVISHLSFSFASQAGTDIAVLKAGIGARALGMGSAFTALANNADAPYWNPAGLSQVSSNEITTMQTKLSTDADHYYISYVVPLKRGSIGISWIQVGLGSIPNTLSTTDAYNEVQNIGIFSYFSNAYLLSYGLPLSEKLSLGITGKYLTSDMFAISGGSAYGYSVTPAVLLKPSNKLTIGAKLDDLINNQQWGTGANEQAPPKIRLGLALILPNPGTFAIDISQILRSTYTPELSAGYEWSQKGLSFRAGYTDSGLSAGAGFESGPARVDYAYVTQAALSKSNVHRISLSGRW